ncbi:MAG: cupredoxin domain-containing protein [Alphaproteobacteria bacterium]|nr:cupredoxin domain-containing protein [Alphaproteobacteria bacterium]
MLRTLFCFSAAVSLFAAPVLAEDYVITIKDHQFSPKELTIPADTKVKLTVKNQDATPEEFESHDLKREKIVKGNSEIVVSVGPLKPGTYKYFGEFHEDTAQGVIIVK